MKKILIIHSNMELGGAETSLLGLLQSIDYKQYSVDLMLMEQKGDLLPFIPCEVNLKPAPKQYRGLVLPIKEVLFKEHLLSITFARLIGKIRGRNSFNKTYVTKQYSQYYALRYLPQISGRYDMAISFIDPHFIVAQKVDAKITLGWLHTDFSRIKSDNRIDFNMWNGLDYVVHISESCKKEFDRSYPQLRARSIVIENILSKKYIEHRANEYDVSSEMPDDGTIKLLTIGRFSYQKNIDGIPELCRLIRASGVNIKWYIIGFGSDELLIRKGIAETQMEDYVIMLGKKDNPYPYIRACNVYIQPSRFEGKCVAVREAQMLGKPVIITNYETSASQLEDGVDGIIAPMDIEGCVRGIVTVLENIGLQERLIANCELRDYSNSKELEKLYRLIENED